MQKFKIGDTVVRNFDGELSVEWGQFLRTTQPTVLKVTAVHRDWFQINNYTGADPYPFHENNFSLVEEEEELPPAPESAMYFNSERWYDANDQHLVIAPYDGESHLLLLEVHPRKGSTRATESIGINLDADAALQLCHDLRRMAMELKRKEKQNG